MRAFLWMVVICWLCIGIVVSQMVAVSANQEKTEIKLIENKHGSIISENQNQNEAMNVLSEQERIDTMVRAFQRLPATELDLIGIDISTPIQSGSESAKQLFEAWKNRQAEFKKAVESMLVPVDHMKTIASRLEAHITNGQQNTFTDQQMNNKEEQEVSPNILDVLTELESLLSDVDNARDFHTIGGWPLLVKQLKRMSGESDIERRALAAWCIGTAIKSNFDYQLWTLEDVHLLSTSDSLNKPSEASGTLSSKNNTQPIILSSRTAIQYLIETLAETVLDITVSDDLIKKTLYALSAAARGNMDVQEAIHHSLSSLPPSSSSSSSSSSSPSGQPFMNILTTLLLTNETSFDVKRKIWSLASDMLEERQFIRNDLLSSPEVLQSPERTAKVRAEIDSFHMLGDSFCTVTFSQLTLQSINQYIRHSSYSPFFAALFYNNIDKNDIGSESGSGNKIIHNKLMSYRAILESTLLVMREQALHCPACLLKQTTSTTTSTTSTETVDLLITAEVHEARKKAVLYVESVVAPILAHSALLNTEKSIPDNIKTLDSDTSSSSKTTSSKVLSDRNNDQSSEESSDEEQEDTVLAHTLSPTQEMVQNSAIIMQALRLFLEVSHKECSLQGCC